MRCKWNCPVAAWVPPKEKAGTCLLSFFFDTHLPSFCVEYRCCHLEQWSWNLTYRNFTQSINKEKWNHFGDQGELYLFIFLRIHSFYSSRGIIQNSSTKITRNSRNTLFWMYIWTSWKSYSRVECTRSMLITSIKMSNFRENFRDFCTSNKGISALWPQILSKGMNMSDALKKVWWVYGDI